MSPHLIDLTIVALYFAAILAFGTWIGKFVRSSSDFFLAGRSLPFWAIGASIVATDIGAIDFVSLGGQTYSYGMVTANMDWIGTMPAIILAALVFVPYYWRSGVYSVPEFLGRRFNAAVRAIQSLVWTAFLVVNIGAAFWAVAKTFDVIVGAEPWRPIAAWLDSLSGGDFFTRVLALEVSRVSPDAGDARLLVYVVVTAVVTGVYTVAGGLTAVVCTDVVQLVLMILGAVLVIVYGLQDPAVGGLSGLHDRIVEQGHADHFTLFLPHDTRTPYPWTGVFFGLTLVLAPAYFIANQAIVQRTLGARDEWSAKAGALFGGFLKFLIPFLVVIPGLIALAKYPDLGDSERGFGKLVQDLVPAGVRGLVIAGFFAAMMSTVDSLVNSAATIITRDLYAGVFRGRADDRRLLRYGRWLSLVLVVFGAATAQASRLFEGIYTFIQSMFSIIQGPTLALLLGGMFWRRATSAGAVAALLCGIALAVGLHVHHKASVWEVESELGDVVVERVYSEPQDGEAESSGIGEVAVCRLRSGALRYRDPVEVVRGGVVVARGGVDLVKGLASEPPPLPAGAGSGRIADLKAHFARNLPEAPAGRPFAARVQVDNWELEDEAAQNLRPGDRIVPFEPAAFFNAEQPFFAIATMAFVASVLVLVAVSWFTRPKPAEELLGLVYRASFHDAEAQAALEERAERSRADD